MSLPTPVNTALRGRVELSIGTLGAGKTTWSALRAVRLARATGRALATTGKDWPEPWNSVASFDDLEALSDSVLVFDEVHLLMPSSRGLLGKETERELVRFLSLCRKRGNCVIGTTQAWSRVATHYRQLVTTVWVCKPVVVGRLHSATPCDTPDAGGQQLLPRQWFAPAAARIPTRAEVWTGQDRWDLEPGRVSR